MLGIFENSVAPQCRGGLPHSEERQTSTMQRRFRISIGLLHCVHSLCARVAHKEIEGELLGAGVKESSRGTSMWAEVAWAP